MWILVLVALLWGATNPFMGSSDKDKKEKEKKTDGSKKHRKSWLRTILSDTAALFSNWRFLVPFGLNQLGSVLYNYSLSQYPVSLAQPIANGLAIPVTAVTAHLLGERALRLDTCLGVCLVLAGAWCCATA